MKKRSIFEATGFNDSFEIDNDYLYRDHLPDAEKRLDKKPNRSGVYERQSGHRDTKKASKKYDETHPEPVNNAHNNVPVVKTSKKEQEPTDKIRSKYHDMSEDVSQTAYRVFLSIKEATKKGEDSK